MTPVPFTGRHWGMMTQASCWVPSSARAALASTLDWLAMCSDPAAFPISCGGFHDVPLPVTTSGWVHQVLIGIPRFTPYAPLSISLAVEQAVPYRIQCCHRAKWPA